MLAKNTVLKIGDSAMSEAFTQITKMTNLAWSGRAWDQEDTTNHDDASLAKAFENTLYSNGSFTFTLTYDQANTQHALLLTKSETGVKVNFHIINVASAMSKLFSGAVTSFAFDTPVGGLLKANVTVMVSGAFSAIS